MKMLLFVLCACMVACEKKPILHWETVPVHEITINGKTLQDPFAAAQNSAPPEWLNHASERDGISRVLTAIDAILLVAVVPDGPGAYEKHSQALNDVELARFTARHKEVLATMDHLHQTLGALIAPMLNVFVAKEKENDALEEAKNSPEFPKNWDAARRDVQDRVSEYKSVFNGIRAVIINDRERLARF